MSAHQILSRLRAIGHRIARIQHELRHVRTKLLFVNNRSELIVIETIMATALDNANQALADLTTEVDATVTFLGTPHPTDSQVQAVADGVNAQTARLTAARTTAQGAPAAAPATPTPTPATPPATP